jgi:PKD repeat protein
MFTPMAMAPVAGFTVKQPVIVSQTAVFSNTTVGTSPISYTWDFGDGLTSTITNPTHVYSNVGSVTVGLTAVNFLGSSTITQTIQVLPPPLPVFLPHVQKSDVITEP